MRNEFFLSPADLPRFDGVVIDCRFALGDPAAGRAAYLAGHIPGAVHLDLDADLSGPVGEHGGRHPLPSPGDFARRLAERGIDSGVPLLLYDDSGYPFAARLWWMLRALGYPAARLLEGGYSAWLAGAGTPETGAVSLPPCRAAAVPGHWPGCCDREGLRELQARGAQLVDAREAVRYRGEQEPIDPVAGHIPGAVNRPWQSLLDDRNHLLPEPQLRALWGDDVLNADPLVAYCGSGVSACVNLLALATLGRDDAWLYGGSWSDWCSYL